MLELHKFLEELEHSLILVLAGDDKKGIIALNPKGEHFIVTKDRKVYSTHDRDKAIKMFNELCK